LTAVVQSSDHPIPLTSPAAEVSDPFLDKPTTNGTKDAHTTGALTITGLAAYLTTISNTPVVRQARVWKRFVRVRTDDLESVRPERAIKRIRSDLASHVSPPLPSDLKQTAVAQHEEVVEDVAEMNGVEEHESQMEKGEPELGRPEVRTEQEIEEERNAAALLEDAAIAQAVMEDLSTGKPIADGKLTSNIDGEEPSGRTPLDTEVAAADIVEDDTYVSTPVAADPPAGRVHRSQSADPDKSSRLSRAYVSCPPNLDGASSQTGDESSISTTDNRPAIRKKRSQSNDRSKHPRKSQRKVVIHDFEMMRVLGKGCAGKVLLVRHKSTSSLYALKAITKRHVLAHQELQHTLTEQAVLKRMAAESKDPFVVKLWWSFHDKENLFLVMVSRPSWFVCCLHTYLRPGFPPRRRFSHAACSLGTSWSRPCQVLRCRNC
jgi:serum/glucocorticoid-regulated kinase 2